MIHNPNEYTPLQREGLSQRLITYLRGCAVLFLVAGAAIPLHAVSSTYWKGGTGLWDTTTANWSSVLTGPFSSTYSAGIGTFFGSNGVGTGIVTLNVDISATAITFNSTSTGYTLALNGKNLTASGYLVLSGATTFDFGNSSSATFANSSSQTWSGGLTINNYLYGTSSLRFGTSSSGLSSTELSLITFTGFGGGAVIDSNGFVTPSAVPEPSTYAALIGLGALGFAALRRRQRG
jgi:hypothetical protein